MLANQYLDLVEELYILNCAIVGEKKSDTMPLYYVEGHLENSSVIKKQITGYWNEIAISSTAVNVMTISEVMDFFELTHLDILFIDAEGCDAEIIASINFDKYDIDSIYFEHLTIDNQSNEKFLNSKGYVISKTDDYNTWVATKQ
jgi:FkbM family methyltransferase